MAEESPAPKILPVERVRELTKVARQPPEWVYEFICDEIKLAAFRGYKGVKLDGWARAPHPLQGKIRIPEHILDEFDKAGYTVRKSPDGSCVIEW